MAALVAAWMAFVLLQAFSAKGDDAPRFRFFEPIPETSPDAPQNDPAQRPAELQVRKPVIWLHTSKTCPPCKGLEEKIDAGEILSEFEVIKVEGQTGGRPVPMFSFPGEDGIRYRYDWGDNPDPEEFRARWRYRNPNAGLPGAATLAGLSLDEQIRRYLPDGTKITIEPPSPVRVVMDDGTVVNYSRLSGTVSTANGNAKLTLVAPLPTVTVSRGVWRFKANFGATIHGAGLETTPAPGAIVIDTNRGRYRFGLLEPNQ